METDNRNLYNLEFEMNGSYFVDGMTAFLKHRNIQFIAIPQQDDTTRFYIFCRTAQNAFDIGAKYVGLVLDMTIVAITKK